MLNFGAVEVLEQQGLTKMPQDAASAWSSFEPIAYVGKQVVKGTNYVFIAEQTLITANPERHIVAIKINEFDGNYNILAIERIF